MKNVRSISAATLTAAMLVALATPAAHATVNGSYSSPTQFSFTVTHMPDFDQVREAGIGALGLPNDGKMYCVPTSALNLAAYIAKHGYPFLIPPGIANWQSPPLALYNLNTQHLALMGALMNTSPTGGTGGTSGWAGFQAFLGNPFIFDVDRYYASGNYSPTTSTIGQVLLNGGVATFCYGRYDHTGQVLTARNSGHCVTVSKCSRSGDNSTIRYRNPSSGGSSTFDQSQWNHTSFDVVDKFFIRNGNIRVMSEMQVSADDDILRIIDSVYAVFPIAGLTDSPPGFTFHKPFPLNSYNPPPDPFSFDPTTIQDLAQSPDNAEAYILTKAAVGGGPGKLHKIDQLSGRDTIMSFDFPDPKAMRFNRHQELYIIDGRSIICVDVKSETPTMTTAILPGDQYNAVACDPNTDEVLVMKPGPGAEVLVFPRSLTGTPVSMPLPATIPLSGKSWFDCCPDDNSLWICSEGDNTVYQAVIDPTSGRYIPGTTIADPSIVNPRCIQLRRCDQLIFAVDGAVKEFRNDPVRVGWTEALDGAFRDTVPGNCFDVSRSNTNHDPAIHEPDWDRDTDPALLVHPAEIPDCIGDMDQDDDVDLDDLQELLFEFGQLGYWRDGDFDQSGGVGLGDLQFLLFNFGTNCARP